MHHCEIQTFDFVRAVPLHRGVNLILTQCFPINSSCFFDQEYLKNTDIEYDWFPNLRIQQVFYDIYAWVERFGHKLNPTKRKTGLASQQRMQFIT